MWKWKTNANYHFCHENESKSWNSLPHSRHVTSLSAFWNAQTTCNSKFFKTFRILVSQQKIKEKRGYHINEEKRSSNLNSAALSSVDQVWLLNHSYVSLKVTLHKPYFSCDFCLLGQNMCKWSRVTLHRASVLHAIIWLRVFPQEFLFEATLHPWSIICGFSKNIYHNCFWIFNVSFCGIITAIVCCYFNCQLHILILLDQL